VDDFYDGVDNFTTPLTKAKKSTLQTILSTDLKITHRAGDKVFMQQCFQKNICVLFCGLRDIPMEQMGLLLLQPYISL